MEDDGDDKDDTKRRTRNLSEKKRRDQFNMLVNELSSMVSTNNRKMDKSTVLKATIAFLKNHNETTVRSRAHDIHEQWKPAFLSNDEFTYLVLEALEGFVMVFSATGRIYYVTESISSLLGHNPSDLLNTSIFDLIFEEDQSTVYNVFQNSVNILDSTQPAREDLPPVRKNLSEEELARNFTEKELSFQCHVRRGTLDFRDDTVYELIQFNGYTRANVDQESKCKPGYLVEADTRLCVCTGRLYTPQLIRDVSLVDSNRNEFTSRHSLEWKFLFLDHRAPPIIGYLPFEVLGTSGYDYYHFDDLEKVVTCHEALMQKGEITSCYYRFLTKGQQWIWLQTRFYITYHQWNSKPEFVVCTHRVVSQADIAKQTRKDGVKVDPVIEGEAIEGDVPTPNAEEALVAVSPSYMSEASDAFGVPYKSCSQPASLQSRSTAGTVATVCTVTTASDTWQRKAQPPCPLGSDTASVSGESRESQTQRNLGREQAPPPPLKGAVSSSLVPQHNLDPQYLEPAPYVGSAVGSLPPMPMLISADQAQIQEQLHRKHEELQYMIVRQQEELRQVKEQLLLARLGILQPLINVQNAFQVEQSGDELQPNQGVGPPQITYEGLNPRPPVPGYPPPQDPTHPTHPNNQRPPHMQQ